jgi:hypothetical protein
MCGPLVKLITLEVLSLAMLPMRLWGSAVDSKE